MTRLPIPGGDVDNWGNVLNSFLLVAHNSDGTLLDSSTISGAQQRSTLTSKGDLYVATGSGATTRLQAGSNGQVLSADSTQATGLKWVPQSGGTVVDPAAAAYGLAAQTFHPALAGNVFGINSGTLVMCLVTLPGTAVSTLGIGVRSAGSTSGGTNVMGLYSVSGTTATLVDQTTDMTTAFSTASSTSWVSGSLSGGTQTLAAGRYYIAALTHFTSAPTIVTGPDVGTSWGGQIPVINGFYPSVYKVSQTNLPSTLDVTTAGLNSVYYYMTVS